MYSRLLQRPQAAATQALAGQDCSRQTNARTAVRQPDLAEDPRKYLI
jgi:hypothetical protein